MKGTSLRRERRDHKSTAVPHHTVHPVNVWFWQRERKSKAAKGSVTKVAPKNSERTRLEESETKRVECCIQHTPKLQQQKALLSLSGERLTEARGPGAGEDTCI